MTAATTIIIIKRTTITTIAVEDPPDEHEVSAIQNNQINSGSHSKCHKLLTLILVTFWCVAI